MTHLYHLAFLRRSVRETSAGIEYLDGQPAPTEEELEASRDAAQAEWDRQRAEDELPARRAQMAEILDDLPVATRAVFWPIRLAVEAALDRGELAVARQIVETTEVPAELAATKAEILELIPA
jgi:hypothetical protein